MNSPTVPPYAASIWVEGDLIHMELPAIGRLTHHRLAFPNDAYGMTRAVYLLKQRTTQSLIGEEGDLTQAQLDRKIRNMKRKVKVDLAGEVITKVKPKDTFAPALRAGARAVMRKMGLQP